MTEVIINGEAYTCITNYKENNELRNSFNVLTQKTYKFDFEFWYHYGYWGDKYIPYSLLKDNKVVANAFVNIIDFTILGEDKRYIQIGTVMTDEEYRGKGLSRFLMELIMKEWENRCDLIYLFANESVLDFYPKFGFVPMNEYQYSKPVVFKETNTAVQKLDMSTARDRDLLYNIADNSVPFSTVSMFDNVELIMFYCTSLMSDEVYYIPAYHAIAIAEFNGDTCYLKDIFCNEPIALDQIIEVVINEKVNEVTFGFTPKESETGEYSLLSEENETLFVKPNMADLFKDHQLRFPILSHT